MSADAKKALADLAEKLDAEGKVGVMFMSNGTLAGVAVLTVPIKKCNGALEAFKAADVPHCIFGSLSTNYLKVCTFLVW